MEKERVKERERDRQTERETMRDRLNLNNWGWKRKGRLEEGCHAHEKEIAQKSYETIRLCVLENECDECEDAKEICTK